MTTSLRYVLRHLQRRRLRTAAGAAGIGLTLALLMAIQIGLDSVATSYTDLVALHAGRADLVVTARDSHWFRPEPFDPAPVQAILARHPAVRGVSPRLFGLVQVGAGAGDQPALLVGVEPGGERTLALWGLQPEPALDGSQCVLSPSLATRLGASPGSRVTVGSGGFGEALALTVEGVLDRQLLLPREVRDYVVVNLGEARRLLGEPARVHALAGTFRRPESYYDARDLQASVLRLKDAGELLAAELGLDHDVRLPKASALMTFQDVTTPLRAVFGVFAVLALAVTGLLIYSILSVAVEERVREYGILRTLGARRRDILRLVLGESCLLCLLGVVPGVFAGTGAAWGVVRFVELAFKATPGAVPLAFSAAHLWATLGIGIVLSLGSALVPAWQATRWQIVDALDPLRRGQVRPTPRDADGPHRTLLMIGLALSGLSVVVFFVLPTAFLSGNSSLIGTVVLGLLLTILLGFTLVGASALPWTEAVVMRLLGSLLGPVADLARRNLQRHRRRNTTTALMFILSIALVIFVASLIVLFSRTAMTLVEHSTGADFRLESDEPEARGLKAELGNVDGVDRVAEVGFLRSRSLRGVAYDVVLSDVVGMKQLWVVPFGVDADLPRVLFTNHIGYVEGRPNALDRVAGYTPASGASEGSGQAEPPVLLSEAAARFLDVGAGDLVQLSFHLGPERRSGRFRVAAVCRTLAGFGNFRGRVANAVGSGLLMPMASFRELTREAPDEALRVRYFVKAAGGPGANPEAVARQLRERFDLQYRFGVTSAAERKREATVMYWATQVFFGLLLAVAVTISVFALIASMASAVLERRWETGMLKALGLRRGQLFRMFLGEAVGITFSAGVTGGGIGFALAWLFMLEAGALAELPITFTMPYLTFVATFGVSLAAAVVAAYLPTRRLLRRPAAEILRLDT